MRVLIGTVTAQDTLGSNEFGESPQFLHVIRIDLRFLGKLSIPTMRFFCHVAS